MDMHFLQNSAPPMQWRLSESDPAHVIRVNFEKPLTISVCVLYGVEDDLYTLLLHCTGNHYFVLIVATQVNNINSTRVV